MRIIGGDMRGRNLRVPRVAVRPTQDRVREALFSSLQTLIPGARVLDLFAGSGAVGLEAWSRGAAEVCWVEESSPVYKVLRGNISLVCGDDIETAAVRCIKAEVFSFLNNKVTKPEFDVVFADPPYEKAVRNTIIPSPTELLDAVLASGLLKKSGVMVLEQGSKEMLPDSEGWELIRDKRYGGTQLRFFRLVELSAASSEGGGEI